METFLVTLIGSLSSISDSELGSDSEDSSSLFFELVFLDSIVSSSDVESSFFLELTLEIVLTVSSSDDESRVLAEDFVNLEGLFFVGLWSSLSSSCKLNDSFESSLSESFFSDFFLDLGFISILSSKSVSFINS